MDEQERRTDLRRRAIFTLLMLVMGSAILAVQGQPEGHGAARLADRAPGAPAAAPPPALPRAIHRRFAPPRVRAGRLARTVKSQSGHGVHHEH